MSIVPVSIRPHLIPFFFREFETEETAYLNKKVTAVKISTKSSIGRTIRMSMVKVGLPAKADHYQLYLSVADNPDGSKEYEGNYYRFESGARSFLALPPEATKDINNLLEDIFRISFVYFVEGYNMQHKSVTAGINAFIDMYDLLEFGFTPDTMRKLYYREKDNKLTRLQNQASNRVNGY